jgi:hypothetical protein
MLLVAVRTQAEMVACIIGEDIAGMGPLGLVGRCEGGRGAIIVNLGDTSTGRFRSLALVAASNWATMSWA